MVRREIIRITMLAFLGLCLALCIYVGNRDWRSVLAVVYVPCIAYGGIAVLKWFWGLFRWFMQMQFMSLVHRSILGILFALIAFGIGSVFAMTGGVVYGFYRIVRNLIEDSLMDQSLAMDIQEKYLKTIDK